MEEKKDITALARESEKKSYKISVYCYRCNKSEGICPSMKGNNGKDLPEKGGTCCAFPFPNKKIAMMFYGKTLTITYSTKKGKTSKPLTCVDTCGTAGKIDYWLGRTDECECNPHPLSQLPCTIKWT